MSAVDSDVNVVRAAFAGTLHSVAAAPGATVRPGETLFTLEAMKMLQEVKSAFAGAVTVVDVRRKIGARVRRGDAVLSVRKCDGDPNTKKVISPVSRATAPAGEPESAGSWAPEAAEIAARAAELRSALGGARRVERQRSSHKLTVVERLRLWSDGDGDGDGSGATASGSKDAPTSAFLEIGSLAATGAARDDLVGLLGRRTTVQGDEKNTSGLAKEAVIPSNARGGLSRLGGMSVVLTADDFTIRGGHTSGHPTEMLKRPFFEALALRLRVPLVRLLDGASGGGTVQAMVAMGASYCPHLPGTYEACQLMNLGIPVISVLLGPVVGAGALRACLSHLCIAVRPTGQLMVAGPPVVAAATGVQLSKEELGGMDVVGPSGSVDVIVETEEDARDACKAFLQLAWRSDPGGRGANAGAVLPPSRELEESLIGVVPRDEAKGLDGREIINRLRDQDETGFFEIGGSWGQHAVVGLGRCGGRSVGFVATDSTCGAQGSTWSVDEARKVLRFALLCDKFAVPIVLLVDVSGFTPGQQSERDGTIRAGTELIQGLVGLRVPTLSVVVRKCMGVGGAALVFHGQTLRLAWPSANWGSLPAKGGVEAALGQPAPDADQSGAKGKRQEALDIQRSIAVDLVNPAKTAEQFGIEEIIDPRATRTWILRWLDAVSAEHEQRRSPTLSDGRLLPKALL